MTTLREAAQQALEALKNLSNCHDGPHDSSGECPSCHERSYMPHAPDCEKQNAITALRTALAQEPEPRWLTKALMADYIDMIAEAIENDSSETLRHKAHWMRRDGEA